MLSTPVVLRAGITNLLQTGDLVNTREADDLSSNSANPTTITAAQFTAADVLLADPNTAANIVTLPTAESIIANIIDLITGNAGCSGCASELSNTTVWAQVEPQTQDCGCGPGQSQRLIDGATFRRTFYRNDLSFPEPIFLEANTGITWDFALENIGADNEVTPKDAVLFHNFEWKTLLFRVLNSSPTISLVGAATIGTAIIVVTDETTIVNATVGQRLYTADDTVFVSSDGQLTVTAIDYFNGEITVSGNAVSSLALLSFTLTPHIEVLPCQSGVFLTTDQINILTHFYQWYEFSVSDDQFTDPDPLLEGGVIFCDRPPEFELLLVRASLRNVSTSGAITIDIKLGSAGGVGGTSIFTTKLTIDEGERTSVTAAVPYVLAAIPTVHIDDAEMTGLLDTFGVDAAGLKIKMLVKMPLP